MPADSGKHDVPEIAFENIVRLGQSVIQPGAFFELLSVHGILTEHDLSSLAALRAQRINFENEFCGPANR